MTFALTNNFEETQHQKTNCKEYYGNDEHIYYYNRLVRRGYRGLNKTFGTDLRIPVKYRSEKRKPGRELSIS